MAELKNNQRAGNCQVGPSPVWYVLLRGCVPVPGPPFSAVRTLFNSVFQLFGGVHVSLLSGGYELLRPSTCSSWFPLYSHVIIYMAHSNTCLQVAKVYFLLLTYTYTLYIMIAFSVW